MAWRPPWKVWLTCFSVTVTLLDTLWLNRRQSRLKKRGATLQQMFDCALFELPWRQLHSGPRVDSEDILTEAKRYLRNPKARTRLTDWYPPVIKAVPIQFARLICQRASLWWDLRQRDRLPVSPLNRSPSSHLANVRAFAALLSDCGRNLWL